MLVRFIEDVEIGGRPYFVGSVADVSRQTARRLMHLNLALPQNTNKRNTCANMDAVEKR